MSRILLDTNAAIWFSEGDRTLGAVSRRMIDRSRNSAGAFISAVSFWEVANQFHTGRLEISASPDTWRKHLLSLDIVELSVDGVQAIRASELMPGHKDAFDRFIVAAAESLDAMLVTSDRALLEWKGKLRRQDARK